MIRRNNEELVAAWGNLVQRVFSQYINNFDDLDTTFEYEKIDVDLMEGAKTCFKTTGEMIRKSKNLNLTLQNVMAYVNSINAYLNETEPWKVIKEDKKRASGSYIVQSTSIDACATMFTPFYAYYFKKL